MAITFSSLQAELSRFADDALQEDAGGTAQPRTFPLPLRIDGWNWAQKVLVQHTPRQQLMTLEIDTDGRSAVLPDDYFDMYGIYDEDEEHWWRQMSVKPGDYRDPSSDIPEFWIWNDKMILERELSHGDDHLTLYYWAYYPGIEYSIGTDDDGDDDPEDITYEQDTVYTPRWADPAMIHLCIAYCWQPGSVQASDINEWKIMMDSGTPMHNPRAAAAWDHYRWWNELMSKVNPAR